MQTYTIELPSYWASYLINLDKSGLDSLDIQECDNEVNGLGYCATVGECEFIGCYNGLLTTLATYTFIR